MKNNKRVYAFKKSKLTIEFGDITTSSAEVIVSSDDYYISMGGGVSAAIRKAGGKAIELDVSKKVPASLGDVVISTAGSLKAQYIFHVITIGPNSQDKGTDEIIKQAIRRCFTLLDIMGLSSISFPAIGMGVAGFKCLDVAVHMSQAIYEELLKINRSIDVTLYLYGSNNSVTPIDYIDFYEQFARKAPDVLKHVNNNLEKNCSIDATIKTISVTTVREMKLNRLNNIRKLINDLEDQRYVLEEQLIESMSKTKEGNSMEKIKSKLKENEEIRLKYLSELKYILEENSSEISKAVTNNPKTIFVSSTYLDLQEHRQAVKDQIISRNMFFRGMEFFGADPDLIPADKIVKEVRNSDIYLGIFGVRYGSIDPATGISMTELEYNEAVKSGKKMLIYVIHEDASIKVSDIENTVEGKNKLNELKRRILRDHTVYKFKNIDDLARQVYEDIGKCIN